VSNEKAIYVPKSSAKARQSPIGEVLRLSFKVDELVAFVREHVNEKGYVNFEVSKRRELGTYGDTHAIKLDTWQPTKQDRPTPTDAPPVDSSDIPFSWLLPLVGIIGAGLV